MKARAADTGFRVITTRVPHEGRGDLRDNERRLKRLGELLHLACDLLVMPAGYLTAKSEREAENHLYRMTDYRAGARAVVFGVDVLGRAKKGQLNSFIGVWNDETHERHFWRQRSRTRAEAKRMPEELSREKRVIRVAGADVVAFASGEIFNPVIREVAAEQKPLLAVVPAHTAAGVRLWAGQQALSKLGVPSVRSVHGADLVVHEGLYRDSDAIGYAESYQREGILLTEYVVMMPKRRKAA